MEPRTDAHHAPQAGPLLKSGDTVTVGCKLPNGLNLGHLHGPDKPVVILNGANHPNAIAGCGLTHGIDKGAMTAWLKDHGGPHGIPAIERGHIFLYDRPGGAVEAAKERENEVTGLEGLDPESVAGIEPEPAMKEKTARAKQTKAERGKVNEQLHKSVG